MLRKTLAALTLLITTTAWAQNRGHVVGPIPAPLPGTTISGFVTAVNGNTIALANGLVTIDATRATITDEQGVAVTITPGSLIFAILRSGTPLQASSIVVTKLPQVTLSGTVQAVSVATGTLQLLGITIHVDPDTSFGGNHIVRSLADIVANDVVQVQANAVGSSLVASSILVFAPMPQLPTLIHGTVKSIGTESWVITDSRARDITVNVNAQTRIIGSPKVGDTVDVLANVDSANNYVAISIMVSPTPPTQMRISGVVKSIGTTTWVIGPAVGLGPDFLVQVNALTKIVGDPRVGDHVDVVVQAGHDGFVAISITKS
jgi:hypothetical protein